MSADLMLFGDPDPDPEHDPEPTPGPAAQHGLAQWLVDDIRRALDGRGLSDPSQRQAAVERVVGRPVTSLVSLTRAEAMRVLAALSETAQEVSSSSWETRDEPTWIDRL